MKLSHFNLTVPSSLIAQYPLEKREESRLMVVNRAKKKITHHAFTDFPSFFRAEDVIVLNNSRVFPGKLYGYKEKTEAEVIITLLRELDVENRLWDVFVFPSRKIRVGNKIVCKQDSVVLEVIDNTTSSCRTIKFCFQGSNEELRDILYNIGEPPLPSFIERKAKSIDKERYQTVYAKEIGSVVAPSAGFHFTKKMLKLLELKSVHLAEITLHIGLNNLKLLNTEDLLKCKVHTEPFVISQEAADKINRGFHGGKKICAVGTSALKTLESSISGNQDLRAKAEGWTSKFITPPYQPKIANALLTNFHIPKSIPFITSLAFGGHELMMEAYEVAKREKYRFFVYGDALLIL